MFKKSKATEIHRLRSAGLSLAHADRLARGRRGGGAVVAVAGGVGVVLIGAIAALSLRIAPDDTPIAQTTPQPAVPLAETVAPAVEPEVATVANAEPNEQSTRLETAVLAALQESTKPAPVETAQAPQAEPADTPQIIAATAPVETAPAVQEKATAPTLDCVAKLDIFLKPLFVQFDVGRTDITADNDELLARISDRIADCDAAYVMVAGHADASGDDAFNMALSWERADQTLNRLVDLGVDVDAIEAVGFGARSPLTQGSSGEDSADRRVDFRVLRRGG